MSYYNQAQINNMGAVIGSRIKEATNPASLATKIDSVPNRNIITDEERQKLAGLEGTKFLGTFLSVGDIPTVNAVAGSYADVDGGKNKNAERWIYDASDAKFVKSITERPGETSSSVKTKYESNANTNAFTDAHKAKLDGLAEAADVNDFTAALDGAMA